MHLLQLFEAIPTNDYGYWITTNGEVIPVLHSHPETIRVWAKTNAPDQFPKIAKLLRSSYFHEIYDLMMNLGWIRIAGGLNNSHNIVHLRLPLHKKSFSSLKDLLRQTYAVRFALGYYNPKTGEDITVTPKNTGALLRTLLAANGNALTEAEVPTNGYGYWVTETGEIISVERMHLDAAVGWAKGHDPEMMRQIEMMRDAGEATHQAITGLFIDKGWIRIAGDIMAFSMNMDFEIPLRKPALYSTLNIMRQATCTWFRYSIRSKTHQEKWFQTEAKPEFMRKIRALAGSPAMAESLLEAELPSWFWMNRKTGKVVAPNNGMERHNRIVWNRGATEMDVEPILYNRWKNNEVEGEDEPRLYSQVYNATWSSGWVRVRKYHKGIHRIRVNFQGQARWVHNVFRMVHDVEPFESSRIEVVDGKTITLSTPDEVQKYYRYPKYRPLVEMTKPEENYMRIAHGTAKTSGKNHQLWLFMPNGSFLSSSRTGEPHHYIWGASGKWEAALFQGRYDADRNLVRAHVGENHTETMIRPAMLKRLQRRLDHEYPGAKVVFYDYYGNGTGNARYLDDMLGESAAETPAFQKWFAGSKVVDRKGQPLEVYHGTNVNDDFTKFIPLQHFGTAQAANHVLQRKLNIPPYYELHDKGWEHHSLNPGRPRTYPVYLSIKKPLTILDHPTLKHNVSKWAAEFRNKKIITPEEQGYIIEPIAFINDTGYRSARNYKREAKAEIEMAKRLVKCLQQHGYDGFKYTNAVEDKGRVRWVVFRPKQVWNRFAERPAA